MKKEILLLDFPLKKMVSEYTSHTHVTPIEKILVKKEDLPEKIDILEGKFKSSNRP